MIVPEKVITCCHEECGISFAVPEGWHTGKRKTHTRFFCPNGHGQSFVSESEEEKLRRERDNAKQQLARAEDERVKAERAAIKAKKETKRLQKRASAGTCPCCARTFSNMATHMKRQHPEFVKEGGANVVPIKVPA